MFGFLVLGITLLMSYLFLFLDAGHVFACPTAVTLVKMLITIVQIVMLSSEHTTAKQAVIGILIIFVLVL